MGEITSIRSVKDLNRAARHLSTICPDMARAYSCVGPLHSRQREEGFAPIIKTIVGQQISLAAASAIWQRLEEAALTTTAAIDAADAKTLKACGLSQSKIKYVQAVARHPIDYHSLNTLADDAIRAHLLPITGVGPWTVDIYLMFSLGRPDIMPTGDVALQASAQSLLRLDTRPTAAQLGSISDRWRPYRSVAAHILWAYYAYEKKREAIA